MLYVLVVVAAVDSGWKVVVRCMVVVATHRFF